MKRMLRRNLLLLGCAFALSYLTACEGHWGIPGGATGHSESLVVDNGGSVAVIDVVTNRIVDTIAMGTMPRGAVALPDNRVVYFPDIGGIAKVGVLDGATNARLEAVAIGNPASGRGVGAGRAVVAMQGKLLYATTDPQEFKVAAIDTIINVVGDPGHGKDLKKIPVSGAPLALATSAAGTRVYVLTNDSSGSATIDVIDASVLPVVDQKVVESFPLPASTGGWTALIANSSDNELYFTNADGLSIFDVATGSPTRGQVIGRMNIGANPGEMAIDGSSRLYVLVESAAQLIIVDVLVGSVDRHKVVGGLPVGLARFIAYDAAQGAIYVANPTDQTVTLWQPDPVLPDTFAPSAPLSLPRVPQGLGVRPIAGVNRLYVSMGKGPIRQVDMFDAVFPDGNWTTTKIYDTTAAGNATASRCSRAPVVTRARIARRLNTWTGGTGCPRWASRRRTCTRRRIHDPAQAGAIDHVDFSFDVIIVSQQGGTPGIAIFPLLKQNGSYYQHLRRRQSRRLDAQDVHRPGRERLRQCQRSHQCGSAEPRFLDQRCAHPIRLRHGQRLGRSRADHDRERHRQLERRAHAEVSFSHQPAHGDR